MNRSWADEQGSFWINYEFLSLPLSHLSHSSIHSGWSFLPHFWHACTSSSSSEPSSFFSVLSLRAVRARFVGTSSISDSGENSWSDPSGGYTQNIGQMLKSRINAILTECFGNVLTKRSSCSCSWSSISSSSRSLTSSESVCHGLSLLPFFRRFFFSSLASLSLFSSSDSLSGGVVWFFFFFSDAVEENNHYLFNHQKIK